MSIIVNKETKVIVQGITGSEGTFHSTQMIEYGNVLPESGKEKEWFKHLSNKLKKKLSKMETRN